MRTTSTGRTTVCLCGSMRFFGDMLSAAVDESLKGHVVVMPLVNMKTEDPRWSNESDADQIKNGLDSLHLDKIRMSQEIVVVTRGGYIGASTRNEIDYAEAHGIPVRYYDAEESAA